MRLKSVTIKLNSRDVYLSGQTIRKIEEIMTEKVKGSVISRERERCVRGRLGNASGVLGMFYFLTWMVAMEVLAFFFF